MDVLIEDLSTPLSTNSPDFSQSDIVPVSDIDLYSLEKGKLYAISKDKKSIYGVFDNPSKAAKSLDNKSDSRYIRRYINLERLVTVGKNKDSVYFVINPDWKNDLKGRRGARNNERKLSSRARSIVLVDVVNNTSLLLIPYQKCLDI